MVGLGVGWEGDVKDQRPLVIKRLVLNIDETSETDGLGCRPGRVFVKYNGRREKDGYPLWKDKRTYRMLKKQLLTYKIYYVKSLRPMIKGTGAPNQQNNKRTNNSLNLPDKTTLDKGLSSFGDYSEESPVSKPVTVSVEPYCHQNRLEYILQRKGQERQFDRLRQPVWVDNYKWLKVD